MKIATIICNHNYGHYLEDAINSALNQNIKTDIYVANDGSTDNTLSVARNFKADIPEQVQLAAVNQDGHAIQYIENPSEQVQLAAVNKNSNAIKYIINKGIKNILLKTKLDQKLFIKFNSVKRINQI